MRAVLQRVSHASVLVDGKDLREIKTGLLILIGIEDADNQEDIDWLVKKIIQMRIFSDEEGKMNRSVMDIQGDLLVISQFTLFASTKKGNRPSYIRSSKPTVAVPLYESFVRSITQASGLTIKTGKFGADMKVNLLNDGPVTITIDTKSKE